MTTQTQIENRKILGNIGIALEAEGFTVTGTDRLHATDHRRSRVVDVQCRQMNYEAPVFVIVGGHWRFPVRDGRVNAKAIVARVIEAAGSVGIAYRIAEDRKVK